MSSSETRAPLPVAPGPVNCTPSPLPAPPMNSMEVCFRWVYEQEADIVQDWWARTVASNTAPNTNTNTSGGGASGISQPDNRPCQHGLLLALHRSVEDESDGDEEAGRESGNRNKSGSTSSTASNPNEEAKRRRKDDDTVDSQDRRERRRRRRQQMTDDVRSANEGKVPLASAAAVSFPFNRAGGVDYYYGEHSSGGGRGEGRATLPPLLRELPCGESYYYALRSRWCARPQPGSHAAAAVAELPSPADSEDLDDSLIMDCICDDFKGELDPPVPLGYMIDSLIPDWEDEGLYEVVRRREAQATATTARK